MPREKKPRRPRKSSEELLFDYLGRKSTDPEVSPLVHRACRRARIAIAAAWANASDPTDPTPPDKLGDALAEVDPATRWLFRGMTTKD